MPKYRPGLGDETGRVFVVENGYLEYRYAPGYTLELLHIEVPPEHRGKGIGKSMVQHLEKEDSSTRSVYGFVAEDNLRAQKFYVDQGYTLFAIPNYYGRGKNAFMILKVLQ